MLKETRPLCLSRSVVAVVVVVAAESVAAEGVAAAAVAEEAVAGFHQIAGSFGQEWSSHWHLEQKKTNEICSKQFFFNNGVNDKVYFEKCLKSEIFN